MEIKVPKLSALSLKTKMELPQAVNEGNEGKNWNL
jgi:hypothetical protein